MLPVLWRRVKTIFPSKIMKNSFSSLMICCFSVSYIIVTSITSGFGLNKTLEDVALGSESCDFSLCFFKKLI